MAAFCLWEKRDGEVSSVSVDGLMPLVVAASQVTGKGSAETLLALAPLSKAASCSFSTANTVCCFLLTSQLITRRFYFLFLVLY